jgi:hypothetical protein
MKERKGNKREKRERMREKGIKERKGNEREKEEMKE